MNPTKTTTTEKPEVLTLRDVTFAGSTDSSVQLAAANLVIREGELAIVRLDRFQKTRDTVSMMQGLSSPLRGEVLFHNKDWRGQDFERHFRMRSKIGRVFDDHAWIQNLNVGKNVTLASEHHALATATIFDEVHAWRKRFGVKDVLRQRPAFVDESILQVYQWIRALILKPKLMILERPMQSVSMKLLPKFTDAVNGLRRSGTGVLWFTANPADDAARHDAPQVSYKIESGKFVPIAGGIA
ncbi:P-loop NTPase family protein [Novipirellula artificiosorum]|uniref:ABC transporter ATP-binding protein YxdL n=1 Tax=Novipirellula artificiosorum TaxID=2528016 RepID=A0A5C6DUT1_9BACT|nr:hypothetical protein [Novipirellula artificiosorum]TWU41123.1 ABC transporter ATP-binding protein YxdL [Novipirellula artificiosorum]